jgi:hypothetical protein
MAEQHDVQAIAAAISKAMRDKVIDRYYFLLRVGGDFSSYPFSWEPFRDLAGPLQIPEGARPIVVRSLHERLEHPVTSAPDHPLPHIEISVAPELPAAAVADAWIAALRREGVALTTPSPWFLEGLRLTAADVLPETAEFLLPGEVDLRPPESMIEPKLSATIRSVGDALGSGRVTAYDIANEIITRHPEYAARQLGNGDLVAPPNARSEIWPIWRDSVASLFDASAVEASKHSAIDGRLFLVGLGILESGLRDAFDARSAWAPLLLEVDEAVAPTGTTLHGYLQAVQFAHGYRSDRASGDDQLGVQGEVNALCEVLMDEDVKPPLSVGLFGEWGSGKSFFMQKMRERIEELAGDPRPRRVRSVTQIRFNAWHYSDTSLWASLATEIFERLADPEPIGADAYEQWLRRIGDPKRPERESLLGELETYRAAKAILDTQRDGLVAQRTAVERRRDAAVRRRRGVIEHVKLVDVAGAVIRDSTVQNSLDEIEAELEVRPAIAELQSLSAALRTPSGYARQVWRRLDHPWLALALFSLGAVALVATAALLIRGDLVAPILAAVGAVAAAMTAAGGVIRPAAKHVNASLAAVSAALRAAEAAEARARQDRSRAERQLDLALAEIDSEIAQATAAAADLTQRIAATEAQVESLSVGRQLYDFLADRAAGYQKHIGVVGMLHRDFRFLDAQLRALAATRVAQADEASSGTAATELPLTQLGPIDRVILYIDDLDRCPPAKVLEVLEAIHLLLALELFIVVVGVDPRWLQRSLRRQYRKLVASGDPAADPYLYAMPIEYLEKIFQIPLTLARMGQAGFSSLISSMAPSVHVPSAPDAPTPTSTRRAATTESAGGDRAPTRGLIEVQLGSSAAGAGGQSIDLTPPEVTFAQRLGALVDSPRAAKRLMNTYRLIRATQHVGSRSRFLGSDGRPGEYQAVLLLLAVAAGYPIMADRVLVALEDDAAAQGIGTWSQFVAALNPGADGAVAGALVPPDIAQAPVDDAGAAQAAIWANMYTALDSVVRLGTSDALDDLAPFQRWGSTVARFSFTL